MMPELLDAGVAALVLAAYIAGLVDAVVGGGGLIQIPALFATFPQAVPAIWPTISSP